MPAGFWRHRRLLCSVFFVVVKLQFLCFAVPGDLRSHVKSDTFSLYSFYDILVVIPRSFFS
jgi:hypothetical protein